MKRILFLSVSLALLLVLRASNMHSQNTNNNNAVEVAAYLGKPWASYGTKTDTSDLSLQAAPGANLSVYVTMAFCINSSASTVQTATIKTGSTVVATVNCPPAAKYSEPTYFDPPLKMGTNAAITMQGTGSVTTTYLFAEGTVAR